VVTRIIEALRNSRVISFYIPTLDRELSKNLVGCETVLDLGCGPKSPLAKVRGLRRKFGVEAFGPYIETARLAQTHDEFAHAMIFDIDFPADSFDAVIMIDVLEHMTEEDGLRVLQLAEKWAAKKVIVNSPNGFIPQMALDGNDLQRHLSGWSHERMKGLGFRSRGLAGPKWLRQEVQSDTMGDDLLSSIRWEPKLFWFSVATLFQPIVYRLPKFAFSLMSVKNVER